MLSNLGVVDRQFRPQPDLTLVAVNGFVVQDAEHEIQFRRNSTGVTLFYVLIPIFGSDFGVRPSIIIEPLLLIELFSSL